MSLLLPPGPFDAYLFDCDGTIADSMPLHLEAWNTALEPWGASFQEELFYAWAGRSTEQIVSLLNQQFGLQMDHREISKRKEECYFSVLPRIQPIAEVIAHIHEAFPRIPLAVVSGSPRESVLTTLRNFQLERYFRCVVGAEDYVHGKPAPDPFLLAARTLGIAPQRCLVFEDADLGIQSAQAAGMQWVKVTRPGTQDEKTFSDSARS
ncbi:HAD family phosphatase [bacterium]|nr:HAD family phosphatase [bacterium]